MNESRHYRDMYYLSRHRTGDNRDWRRKGSLQSHRKTTEEKNNKRRAKKRAIWGVTLMICVVLILSALIIYLMKGRTENTVFCVPGFVGPNCEKSNFLGTHIWSTDDFYVLADGLQHRKGIAFRVYAPRARAVSLKVKPDVGLEHSYTMMLFLSSYMSRRKQANGYWFYNAGSVGVHAEYYYQVESETGEFTDHLIQGGKEV